MDKDKSLNKNLKKLIFLVCGDSKTGKKTIVNFWLKNKNFKTMNNVFYTVYIFPYEQIIENNIKINIEIEIRILNSEEFETNLKTNSNFYKNAFGGFIITSIDDEISFINGEKWKEKIDYMCTLPNKFPLPIFLLINKCDLFNFNNPEKEFQKTNVIKKYFLENQFFCNFYIISNEENNENNDNNIIENNIININENNNINNNEIYNNVLCNVNLPLINMINLIFKFNDIKNEFLGYNNLNNNKTIEKNSKCNIY